MAFSGIPHDALVFYEQLEADNAKPWWEDNKARYKEVIKTPVQELCAELSDYGDFHLFRPHNDLRFAKNKPPYKTHQGAYTEGEGGTGFYFQLSAQGLMAGTGYYGMAKDQLVRFREAIDDDKTGPQIEKLAGELSKKYEVGAIGALKTAPRGYPKDHPRIELLRRKGLMMSKDFGSPQWLHTRRAVSRIRDVWDGAAKMNAWLDKHVGPTTLEPDRMFG